MQQLLRALIEQDSLEGVRPDVAGGLRGQPVYDDFYQREEVLVGVEHQVLQAGQRGHRKQGGTLHSELGRALRGQRVAQRDGDDLQEEGLADGPPHHIVLEEAVQVVEVVIVGDLPPLLTHERYLCVLKHLEVGEVCRVFWLR